MDNTRRIIAIANQKGGVGKSTTAQAVAAGCSLLGYRTLLIDLDAQGNSSSTFGDLEAAKHKSIFEVLMGETKARDACMNTPYCDLIPSSPLLAQADIYLTDIGKEYRLKEAIDTLQRDYDFVVIDTPPTLGILTVNALVAADTVVIPTTGDLYALQGVRQLYNSIQTVRKYCNPALTIGGILFTQFDGRRALTKDVLSVSVGLSRDMDTRIFSTKIRNAQAIRDAQALHDSIYHYDPKSKVARDYNDFVRELVFEVMGIEQPDPLPAEKEG